MSGAVRSALLALILATATASAQDPKTASAKTDGEKMGQGFQLPVVQRNYDRREVMVPMRDEVKLFTVIFVPKDAHEAPIMLTRTPYNAAAHVRNPSALPARTMLDELSLADEGFVENGYIRV